MVHFPVWRIGPKTEEIVEHGVGLNDEGIDESKAEPREKAIPRFFFMGNDVIADIQDANTQYGFCQKSHRGVAGRKKGHPVLKVEEPRPDFLEPEEGSNPTDGVDGVQQGVRMDGDEV